MRASLQAGRAVVSPRWGRWVALLCLVAGPAVDAIPHASRRTSPHHGGRLVSGLRSEPKTLNPVTAVDVASRDVIERMHASLLAIDRETQGTVPHLAESWSVSDDGRRYELRLREGLRFSDGEPLDTDDVVFSLDAYLDVRNASPQRGLLIVGGEPIRARAVDRRTVVFELSEPYAAAERLFDGLKILPRHRLGAAQREGRLGSAWGLGAAPREVVGAGPFRFRRHVAGERLVLERNPHYWKRDAEGAALPYLDELVFLSLASQDAQVIRFQAGDTDVIEGLSAEDYAVLERDAATRGYVLRDLGPGLEYSFVFFNLNDLPGDAPATLAARQVWFRKQAFRQAVSRSIDRPGLVRLAYRGRAATLASHVTPGNRLWFDASLQPGLPSGAEARALLRAAGFSWDPEDRLVDAAGEHVEFSILTSAGNATRRQMATIVQDDLTQLGMRVHVVPLETSALLERVLRSFDYEACLLALRSGDVDPNSEMNVWLSSGATHLWSLSGSALPAWQQEIDSLMHRQLSTLDHAARKQLYARVQAIVADQLPIIPLVSPSILVGVKKGLENFRPAILSHYTLWNADELYWRRRPEGSR